MKILSLCFFFQKLVFEAKKIEERERGGGGARRGRRVKASSKSLSRGVAHLESLDYKCQSRQREKGWTR